MKAVSFDKKYLLLSLFVIALLIPTFEFSDVIAQDTESTITVFGRVTDVETGQPIQDAAIIIWEINIDDLFDSELKDVLKTDVNGDYSVSFEGRFSKITDSGDARLHYRIYAVYDNTTTPGYDYIPMFQEVRQFGEANLDYQVIPGASVILENEQFLVVDFSHTPYRYEYIVVPEEKLPQGSVVEFGELLQSPFLNLSLNHLIVPANEDFKIELRALGVYFDFGPSDYSFLMDDPNFFLDKGESVNVNVLVHSIPLSINVTKNTADITEKHIQEAEEKGLYTTTERQALKRVWSMIETAESKYEKGLYKESYTDLKEAYEEALKIDGTVQRLYGDASTAVYSLIFPFAFTSILLSYLFIENKIKRILAAVVLYIPLLAVFFSVYPGAQIVEFSNLLTVSAGAIIVSIIGGLVLARVFRQTLAVIFSMARRNLLRRKVRFLLTLITIVGIVTTFVSLTSFTSEHGFVSKVIGTSNLDTNGILIKKPFTQSTSTDSELAYTFTPIEVIDLERVQGMSEITMVAPKVENFPSLFPFITVQSSSEDLSVNGILGLSANEAELTDFEELVVKGRYLIDGENDSVLISVEAAEQLNVDVGDTIILEIGIISTLEVNLVGLFDDSKFSQINDFDGSPMIPDQLYIESSNTIIAPCEPSQVIVMDWQTALGLPLAIVEISRLDVLVNNSVDALEFSRQISLNLDYWVWTVVNQDINFFGIAFYPTVRGLEIFVPWIIAISIVVITMFGAIHERQDEVVVLSSVGLNPSHISYLFFAESLIIGLIGGGIGYLLGQGSYKVLDFLPGEFLVEQKVSAVWIFASFLVAITAVIVGTTVALKFSTIITPSLLLRWSGKGVGYFTGEPLVISIPFRVREDNIDSMFKSVVERYRRYLKNQGVAESSGTIRRSEEETNEISTKSLEFNYSLGDSKPMAGSFPFQLIARRSKDDEIYSLEVNCKGSGDIVEETVSFLRQSLMEWSAKG